MPSSARPHSSAPDRHPWARALDEAPFLVVGFCAAWCDTCGAFSAQFDQIAKARDDATFVWLDIEDHAELASDIDIEDFPTIAVYHRERLIHFGTTLPQSPIIERLLDSLDADSSTVTAVPALTRLPARLSELQPGEAERVLRAR